MKTDIKNNTFLKFRAIKGSNVLYFVPQNSRNNSVGQGQLMLENYEKNNK
jgi:hypothetical protein